MLKNHFTEDFMGFFSDFLFGPSSNSEKKANGQKNSGTFGNSGFFDSDNSNYYEELAEDARSGDLSAIQEMRDEFGENWREQWGIL
jgi:hypothetical protein